MCFHRKQLGKLKYLLMCIKESCRLFAPVPMISRTLDRTYEIDGHLVPEGTVCIDHKRSWLVRGMHLSIALIPSCQSLTGGRRRFFQVWEEHGVLYLPIIDICEYVKLLFFGKFFKIYLSNKKFLKWCKRRRQHRVVLGPGRNVWFLSPLPSSPPPPPMLFALFTTSFKFLTVLYPKRRQNDKINTSCVLWKNISFSSGTWVMTNVYALHLNPHVWRDPKVCVFELAPYWQIIIKKWLPVDVLH